MLKIRRNGMVTIIIPVYNTDRRYLGVCLESILSQTYKKIEVIIVDDGSNKEIIDFVESFQEKDERVQVIHRDNHGVSAARNVGIESAHGEYIFFCDSDDYVDAKMLSEMIEMAENTCADMVVAGYYFEIQDGDKRYCIEQKTHSLYLKNENEVKNNMVALWDDGIMYNIWNKLFRTQIIKEHNIRFPYGKAFNEDRDFVRDYLKHTYSLKIMDVCFYHYLREVKTSATGLYREDMLDIRKEEYHRLMYFFKEMNIRDFMEYVSREHLDRVVATIENLFYGNLRKKAIKSEIKRIITDVDTKECLKHAIPKSNKMKIIYGMIRTGRTNFIYFLIREIHVLRGKHPKLYYKLRKKR